MNVLDVNVKANINNLWSVSGEPVWRRVDLFRLDGSYGAHAWSRSPL